MEGLHRDCPSELPPERIVSSAVGSAEGLVHSIGSGSSLSNIFSPAFG